MINSFELYEDVLDKVNESSNGQLSFDRFNRWSWLAQLRLIDWLTGDVANIIPPTPYLAQKNRDWLSVFITKTTIQVLGGSVPKPADYYTWENGYLLGNYNVDDTECDEEKTDDGCNIPIQLLSGDDFFYRCNTNVEGLQPSFLKPIVKEIGKEFQFLPKDTGSIAIEYIRYPVKARIGYVKDEQYNELVYDAATSVDFEWEPFAQDILAWFIADQYFNFVSNQAGKTYNLQSGKTVRDIK